MAAAAGRTYILAGGEVPTLNELAALITPQTKFLIINSPANPTGGVLTHDDLEAIAALAVLEGDEIRLRAEILTEDGRASISNITANLAVLEGWAGDRYGIPVESTIDAILTSGRTEAMIIDPVYEGKSMAGLVDLDHTDVLGDTPKWHRYDRVVELAPPLAPVFTRTFTVAPLSRKRAAAQS